MIHLAFKHDLAFSGDFQGAVAADRRAVETFGEALAGSDRPFVIASGHRRARPRAASRPRTTRRDAGRRRGGRAGCADRRSWRSALAARGVRSSVVRLPPTVHGDGDNGFIATLVGIARDKGVSGYVGDGSNRWPAVHRLDAARLFRLALEQAPAGSVLHAVADEGVPVRDIAEVIGRHLDVPVVVRRARGRRRALRLARRLPRGRQPGVERDHPGAARLAPDRTRAARETSTRGTTSRALLR